jgi:ubiquinone biosynthesis protein UbiJ
MRFVGSVVVAFLMLALVATGAAAQCGGGCGGSESPAPAAAEKGCCGTCEKSKECAGDGSCGKCEGECGEDGKCSGECGEKCRGEDGKCSGECEGRRGTCSGECKDGEGECAGSCAGKKARCDGSCAEPICDGSCGKEAGGPCDCGAVEAKCDGSCRRERKTEGCGGSCGGCSGGGTAVAEVGIEELIGRLEVQAKKMTVLLRDLEEAGKTEEAREVAAGLKQLRAQIAELKELAAEDLAEEAAEAPSRGFLGVRMDPEHEGDGVRIDETVEGSPARKAGIAAGDVILAVNGKAVNAVPELAEVVGSMKPGAAVTLVILRGEKKMELALELATFPTATLEPEEVEEDEVLEEEFEEQPDQPFRGRRPLRAQPRRLVVAMEPPTPQMVARQDRKVAELTRKLQELRAAAQASLGSGRDAQGAELAMAAAATSRALRQETVRLAAMKEAIANAPSIGIGGGRAKNADDRLDSVEARLSRLEKRLQRIEGLLERLADRLENGDG